MMSMSINQIIGCMMLMVIVVSAADDVVDGEEKPATPLKAEAPLLAFRQARTTGLSVPLTDRLFGIIVNEKSDWIIKFYAPWCPACLELAPIWSEFAKGFKPGDSGRDIRVGDVDSLKNLGLQAAFRIKSYPTIVFFREGRVYEFTGERMLVSSLNAFALTDWSTVEESFTIPPKSPILEIIEKPIEQKPISPEEQLQVVDAVNREKVNDGVNDVVSAIVLEDRLPSLPRAVKLYENTFDARTSTGVWFVKICSSDNLECRSIVPAWDRCVEGLSSTITFGEVDAARNGEFLRRYQIRSVPALLFLKDGESVMYKGFIDPESMTLFANGGWLAVDAMDRSRQPKQRTQKGYRRSYFRAALLISVLVSMGAYALYHILGTKFKNA